MAKKKKSTTDQKQQMAQYRNNYLRELKKYINQINPNLYSRLSKLELEALFMSRGTMVRPVGDGMRLPAWMSRYCDDFIRSRMQEVKIEIIPGRFSVNLLEYSMYMYPIDACAKILAPKATDDPTFEEFIIGQRSDRLDRCESNMNALAIILMRELCHPARQYCNIKYEIGQENLADGRVRLTQYFRFSVRNPREGKIIFKNRETRNGFELLYNYFHLQNPDNIPLFTEVKLPPSHFGVKTDDDDDKPYPVIITRHAIDRMEERLGCLVIGYASAQIVESLLNARVHHKSKDGKLLIEYSIQGVKAGYLQIDVREEVILIRTFLFLTNASTPEGMKLRSAMGLQKEDIKFFNMDKLTPLMESDLLTDEEMCKRLREAGCESLIELYEAVKDSGYWNYSDEKKELAAKLKKYMMEEEEFLTLDA